MREVGIKDTATEIEGYIAKNVTKETEIALKLSGVIHTQMLSGFLSQLKSGEKEEDREQG